MTNNPTIDGVQRAEPEVVGWAHPRDLQSDGYSHSFTVRSEQPGTPYQDGNFPVALIQAEDHYAEVTALQSTIARLEAQLNNAINLDFQRRERITQLESEKELMLRGADVYKERIAELESDELEWSAMQQRLGDENVRLRSRIAELTNISEDFLKLADTPSDLPLGFGADLLKRIRACLDATAALNKPKPAEWHDVAGDDEGVVS